MHFDWDIIKAFTQCQYKAWSLASSQINNDGFSVNENILEINLPAHSNSLQDKTATIAWFYNLDTQTTKYVDRIRIHMGSKSETIKLSKPNTKAKKLLTDFKNFIDKKEPPPFYKNPRCNECHLREGCLKN